MKTFTITVSMALVSLGLASPTIQKRQGATITVYQEKHFAGAAQVISFGDGEQICEDLKRTPSSIKVDPVEGSWYCQLFNQPRCNPTGEGGKVSGVFNWNIEDLVYPCREGQGNGSCKGNDWDNIARSIYCSSVN
ncbi:hypothetical protein CC78DRAFT_621833 [Lojkania enalia]|uniref:Uncharacterized protein n=1 Tax=Lojkania enalia TaxID=147567 RepID=A0A9P4K1F8_9PLEO|nr:hypothetical protein CC78DRAFT_621833 [Didymosphaeria enalia]